MNQDNSFAGKFVRPEDDAELTVRELYGVLQRAKEIMTREDLLNDRHQRYRDSDGKQKVREISPIKADAYMMFKAHLFGEDLFNQSVLGRPILPEENEVDHPPMTMKELKERLKDSDLSKTFGDVSDLDPNSQKSFALLEIVKLQLLEELEHGKLASDAGRGIR